MSEWYNGIPGSKYEVWDNAFVGENGESPDVVLVYESNSKQECEDYIKEKGSPSSYELKENGVCEVCDLHDKRVEALAQGRMLPFLVVATGTSRHYGGPEEGGWWYDRESVLEVRRAFTLEQGLRHMRELRESYPQPRYNRFSCANRGEPETHIRCVYGELDPRMPQESPPGRPRYE